MKKILIGLLAVFAACNTVELPNKGKESIRKHKEERDYFDGYNYVKSYYNGYNRTERKVGKCFMVLNTKDKYYHDSYFRLVINDGKRPPCITKYAYSVNNWDGVSSKHPKFSDDNVAVFVYKNREYRKLGLRIIQYYARQIGANYGYNKLDGCNFFIRYAHIPFDVYTDPNCMILKKEYVTPLTKVEAEEYIKNHPEAIDLREDKCFVLF